MCDTHVPHVPWKGPCLLLQAEKQHILSNFMAISGCQPWSSGARQRLQRSRLQQGQAGVQILEFLTGASGCCFPLAFKPKTSGPFFSSSYSHASGSSGQHKVGKALWSCSRESCQAAVAGAWARGGFTKHYKHVLKPVQSGATWISL